jgi:adenosylcobinamide-GDP ribazoletransferase
MKNFFIGLQFLTRIRLVTQTEWSLDSFGKSVKYFPLVGLVIGSILAIVAYFFIIYLPLHHILVPKHIISTVLLILSILITGGLHCDGFMDTMDGVFSGRARDTMLEIMKDSRVGANGVTAFIMLILCKWSLLLDILPENLVIALFIMPIISRLGMVMGITLFPYARPDGMGKAFAQYADKKSLMIAILSTFIFVVPLGAISIISMISVAIFTILFCKYITNVLGGLTGDVYGALTELSEVIVLVVFLFN